jgi:hypothetical protein
MKNKSNIYGGYGGVTKQNYYVPPSSPDFVPQAALVAFTTADQANLQVVADNIGFYAENGPNIMLRTSVPVGNEDVFTITTEANPQDRIVYTADDKGVNLNVINGGIIP